MNRWVPICQECWQENNPGSYFPDHTDIQNCTQCGNLSIIINVHPSEIRLRIGFTGTQEGMSIAQLSTFYDWFPKSASQFHHGDCVGADENADGIVRMIAPDTTIVIHPPSDSKKRAFCPKNTPRTGTIDIVHPVKPYLDRNKDIVDDTRYLIATPKGPEELRSGTWSTIRYARKLGRPIMIIYPDGTVVHENEP